jgi:hypothetical protein
MNIRRQRLFGTLAVLTTSIACSLSGLMPGTPTPVDQVGTIVATTMQALTAAPSENSSTRVSGTPISFENVSFVIPNGLAGGATPETMTAVDTNGGAPWEVAPTHLRFSLTGYPLQGQFHEPRIFVYRAHEYAQINPVAAEQIENIKKILAGSTILQETVPRVPWFNAELLIAASIQIIPFQNGRGVRTLTQYAQYAAPINNHELFYHFEGLTSDGNYYVIAILPITVPILPEDEKPEASVPAGGVPIPADIGITNSYYSAVAGKLNSLAPDAYTPSLRFLDSLIQSIQVTSP